MCHKATQQKEKKQQHDSVQMYLVITFTGSVYSWVCFVFFVTLNAKNISILLHLMHRKTEFFF